MWRRGEGEGDVWESVRVEIRMIPKCTQWRRVQFRREGRRGGSEEGGRRWRQGDGREGRIGKETERKGRVQMGEVGEGR